MALGLNTPSKGVQNWHEPLNENFEALDVVSFGSRLTTDQLVARGDNPRVEFDHVAWEHPQGHNEGSAAEYIAPRDGLYLILIQVEVEVTSVTSGPAPAAVQIIVDGDKINVDPGHVEQMEVTPAWDKFKVMEIRPLIQGNNILGRFVHRAFTDLSNDELPIVSAEHNTKFRIVRVGPNPFTA